MIKFISKKGCIEIMSEFFDGLYDKATSVAKLTKLNSKILGINASLEKAYTELGKAVYGASDENANEISQKISDLLVEKGIIKEQIDKITNVKRCPDCGSILPDKNRFSVKFCNNCGAEIPGEPEEPEESEETASSQEEAVCEEDSCCDKEEERVIYCTIDELPEKLRELNEKNKKEAEKTGCSSTRHKVDIAPDGSVTITEY